MQILTSQVQECSDFILVVTRGCLERCSEQGDWVTREIAEALKLEKNIVPLCFEEFTWPEYLPPEIADLRGFQVCRYSREYHEASIERLVKCLQAKPLWTQPMGLIGRVAAGLSLLAAAAFGILLLAKHLPSAPPPPPNEPLAQTMLIEWPRATNATVDWSDVTLRLDMGTNAESRQKKVDANGRVTFDLLPAAARDEPATVTLESESWELLTRKIPRLSGKPLYLQVEHKPFTIHGSVKNEANSQAVKGVWVSVAGIGTNTDADGRFALPCPGFVWRPQLELLATNLGWLHDQRRDSGRNRCRGFVGFPARSSPFHLGSRLFRSRQPQ